MIIFLEGLTKERKVKISEILKKEFEGVNIFALGLIYNKLQKEKYNNIEFNYDNTIEDFADIPNITFYLDDVTNEDREEYLKEIASLKLDNTVIDANNRNNKAVAKEIIDYVYREM